MQGDVTEAARPCVGEFGSADRIGAAHAAVSLPCVLARAHPHHAEAFSDTRLRAVCDAGSDATSGRVPHGNRSTTSEHHDDRGTNAQALVHGALSRGSAAGARTAGMRPRRHERLSGQDAGPGLSILAAEAGDGCGRRCGRYDATGGDREHQPELKAADLPPTAGARLVQRLGKNSRERAGRLARHRRSLCRDMQVRGCPSRRLDRRCRAPGRRGRPYCQANSTDRQAGPQVSCASRGQSPGYWSPDVA